MAGYHLPPRWLNAVTKNCTPPLLGSVLPREGVQVERAMRYALDATWEKGNLEELYRLFPYEVREDRGVNPRIPPLLQRW